MSMNGITRRAGGSGRRGTGPNGENVRNARTTFQHVLDRKQRASDRQAVADLRTPQEQLERLDRAFGFGQGAEKERAKLAARIKDMAALKDQPAKPPKKAKKGVNSGKQAQP